jgi:hypothetical protein
MSSQTSRYEELDRVFSRSLRLVDSALIKEYRLSPEEASEVEQSLFVWFRGFGRRPGSPKSAEALRRHLLNMACQAGHVYWSGKLGSSQPNDETLKRTLALGPQQIAIEIEEQAGMERNAPGRDEDREDGR